MGSSSEGGSITTSQARRGEVMGRIRRVGWWRGKKGVEKVCWTTLGGLSCSKREEDDDEEEVVVVMMRMKMKQVMRGGGKSWWASDGKGKGV